jgi:hypothetical protein
MATLADVTDAALAIDQGEDSFSILPLLLGQDTPIRTNSISCSIRGVPSLRDGAWKCIPAPGSGGWGKGGDQSQAMQLYHLADDLGETRNLANKHPEKLAGMMDLLEKLIVNGRSTPGPKQANDVPVRRYPAKR